MKNKKIAATVFEIHGEFGNIRQADELTADELQSYGISASFPAYRPNCKIVTAKLVLADTPFCPEVEGRMPKGMNYIIPKQALHDNLCNIINMPVHITSDLAGHAEKSGEERKYVAIGTVLGQKITEEAGKTWGQVLLALWDDDHPEEVGKVSANKENLGTSIEFMFTDTSLERVNANTFNVWSFLPKGLAILFKNKAAFPQTQLLIAQKGEANLPIPSNNMSNAKIVIETDGTIESTKVYIEGLEKTNLREINLSIYPSESNVDGEPIDVGNYLRLVEKMSPEGGLDVRKEYRLSASGVEESEYDNEQQGGERNMVEYKGIKLEAEKYTPDMVVGILKDFEASVEASESQKQVLAEKDTKIAELQKSIDDFKAADAERAKQDEVKKAESKKAEAKSTAEQWFEKNKDAYPADQKDKVVEIRAKVELGEATSAEVLQLAELKSITTSTLPTGGDNTPDPKAIEKEDAFFGIRNAQK